jgi:NADPH:quinone reductase-like Zn-dependent oxidoreductase
MTRYGNAHAMQLQEVPQPRAVDGEVLIRVQAAGLNPVDYKLRQLLGRLVWPLDLPLVAGSELFGVQMSATVATTASSKGEKLVRSLGAETVVNYRERKFKDVLSGYDAAFDTVGGHNLTDSFDILKRGTKLVSVASIDPTSAREDFGMGPLLTAVVWVYNAKIRSQSRRTGVSYRSLLMRPSGEDLGVLASLVDSGRLKAVTDRVFPFEQIAEAFAYLEQGHAKGKVVVRL